MNKEGLDYNTQREKLVMPEYGREIQQMVDYCVQLEDRNERQHCAEAIIVIMDRMFPENRGVENHEQKLWDHLAIMSGFQLDIDYPYDVQDAEKISKKPAPIDRNLVQWSHGSCDEQKVASDLARFTDGRIQLNLDTFEFEKVKDASARNAAANNKKKK